MSSDVDFSRRLQVHLIYAGPGTSTTCRAITRMRQAVDAHVMCRAPVRPSPIPPTRATP